MHLYRHVASGGFAPDELDRLLQAASVLPQLRLCGADTSHEDPELRPLQEKLSARVATLSPRERDVCVRIALGRSVDGIAAELGVATGTVTTLRRRAYAKLAQAGVFGGRLALMRMLLG